MKFTIVAVLLALAFAAEASAIGHPEWSAWGNTWHGAYDDGHHDHHGYGTHGISLNQDHGWDHHDHHHHAPAHHAHHDHHHDHHDHHHASHYVAKTLGAVHTAPLVGHIESVKSLNVAPAPGSGYDHHHHHAPAHHGHHDHHHHASHYVAKTLGAVHTAPLPGHVDSVKSLNVASAPGTH